MAHILCDLELLAILREEVNSAISRGSDALEHRLEQELPRLKTVYLGVLRLTASSSTVRDIHCQTEIGGKPFGRVPISLSPTVSYISTQTSLAPMRINSIRIGFLHDPYLSKNPSFRRFGSGETRCPGRHLAVREIPTFVASALHRFDIEMIPECAKGAAGSWPRFPRVEK